MIKWWLFLLFPIIAAGQKIESAAWIRINQLGYTPDGIKVAVFCGKRDADSISMTIGLRVSWSLHDAKTNELVYEGRIGENFGDYGPFKETRRLNFSGFKKPGKFYLLCRGIRSPEFEIGKDVYKGAADFCLRYMRQQRTGFNPYLKDSCHTHDGYVLYGEKAGIKDSTRIDVVGGWHDASDYLQYSTTSANATYHLLAAYRDFSKVFTDEKQANGLDGKNGMADVLDEAKWGLDWLLKMNPRPDWMFNQIADDRDHMGMRIPKQDTFYGRGYERPVYFVNGEPQQRGKFLNNTTGTSSTAGKFASTFALGHWLFDPKSSFLDKKSKTAYYHKAFNAHGYGLLKKGVTQTASVRSPYIYAEENWTDDMELASASLAYITNQQILNGIYIKDLASYRDKYLNEAYEYAQKEPITPWLGADTAKHYQWYPFINLGHYELAKQITGKRRDTIVGYYREGIQRVWNKAKANAFYRGIPYIWCSNNLTTSFAIQCYWYKELTGDQTFSELEQANFDWLFGCNPWGTSMVYGLPSWGDTPVDPHSAFTHIKNYPIDGGLVDGPVYESIYKGLIGIKLYQPDEYEAFQSDLAVYHDDYGDYSTNEPTMDGTASLIYLLAAKESESNKAPYPTERGLGVRTNGAHVRGDTTKKNIALVFTGHEFAEGRDFVAEVLDEEKVKASFFFTGDYYRNPAHKKSIRQLKKNGHYLGAHSDKHLLYCDWTNRDSLLVTKKQFKFDLADNYTAMARHGIDIRKARYFLPPYEWYNDSIAKWTSELQLRLISFTPGTKSNADYTWPALPNYLNSEKIYQSIVNYEGSSPSGLNGFMLLMHLGTDPRRPDHLYAWLGGLIRQLRSEGYHFQRVDELLEATQ